MDNSERPRTCQRNASKFIADLASRLAHRVQLTTDGHRAYLTAVENVFGSEVDDAMLDKLYSTPPREGRTTRYSPADGAVQSVERPERLVQIDPLPPVRTS